MTLKLRDQAPEAQNCDPQTGIEPRSITVACRTGMRHIASIYNSELFVLPASHTCVNATRSSGGGNDSGGNNKSGSSSGSSNTITSSNNNSNNNTPST